MDNLFVPYKECMELKQLGFDEECFGFWRKDEDFKHLEACLTMCKYTHSAWIDEENFKGYLCHALLYQQAFKWLYQKLDIEKGVMPLDTESQQLVLKELIEILKNK